MCSRTGRCLTTRHGIASQSVFVSLHLCVPPECLDFSCAHINRGLTVLPAV